jgi:hypothetical protein
MRRSLPAGGDALLFSKAPERAETDLPADSGFATSRAQSMKSCATGVSVRFFSVMMPSG